MITYTSETTATIQTDKYTFLLDSGELGLPEHAQMLIDFQDEAKLKVFCNLLDTNPSTAFIKYINGDY